MRTYTMTCFKLPVSLTKCIQSALTRFRWDGNDEKRKVCWIAWLKLTKSRKEGGLGFRDLPSFNNALLAKVSWRILTQPTCLLARILLSNYCHEAPFLDCKIPTTVSHGWRGICEGRELIKPFVGKAIGDGKSTRVWQDPWLSLDDRTAPIGPPTEEAQNMLVAELMSPHTGNWDIDKIRTTIPEWEASILEI
ncbi:unnamed protein product [Microthlaspi erraticum]|uniref:Reverse transcriptase zinc-binding domain-containing protein n=1 Tax=Microthlaspi erraticum TaxID=1685480 RepID=A0A6D2L4X8_9BRAS|nr:unnamed protein product [Microthlaspi erraticum]